jgi:hypothetical protein
MSEILKIESQELAQAFILSEQLDAILHRIEKETLSHVYDPTTKEGAEGITSLAYKVARSKNTIDAAGKKLNDSVREQIRFIDKERKRSWDRLEALQNKIKEPLRIQQENEKKRIDKIKTLIADNFVIPMSNMTSVQIKSYIESVGSFAIDTTTFQEFTFDACKAQEDCLKALNEKYIQVKEVEEKEAELATLRAMAEQMAKQLKQNDVENNEYKPLEIIESEIESIKSETNDIKKYQFNSKKNAQRKILEYIENNGISNFEWFVHDIIEGLVPNVIVRY